MKNPRLWAFRVILSALSPDLKVKIPSLVPFCELHPVSLIVIQHTKAIFHPDTPGPWPPHGISLHTVRKATFLFCFIGLHHSSVALKPPHSHVGKWRRAVPKVPPLCSLLVLFTILVPPLVFCQHWTTCLPMPLLQTILRMFDVLVFLLSSRPGGWEHTFLFSGTNGRAGRIEDRFGSLSHAWINHPELLCCQLGLLLELVLPALLFPHPILTVDSLLPTITHYLLKNTPTERKLMEASEISLSLPMYLDGKMGQGFHGHWVHTGGSCWALHGAPRNPASNFS